VNNRPDITIYTIPTCGFCHAAKDYFMTLGLDYREIDVSNDPARQQQMRDVSGQVGTPVIRIDGEVVIGFDRARIDQALDL